MLHPIRKLASCAVLAATAFLGTTSLAQAQAMPIANGHPTAGPSIVTPAGSDELPDGSIAGSGKMTNKAAGGWFQFGLHSYMYAPDGTHFAAGIVSKEHNTGGFWEVGDTVILGVIDNVDGSGNGLDKFLDGRVPAAFGTPTIQELLAMFGFPPPEIFREGISGNFHFH